MLSLFEKKISFVNNSLSAEALDQIFHATEPFCRANNWPAYFDEIIAIELTFPLLRHFPWLNNDFFIEIMADVFQAKFQTDFETTRDNLMYVREILTSNLDYFSLSNKSKEQHHIIPVINYLFATILDHQQNLPFIFKELGLSVHFLGKLEQAMANVSQNTHLVYNESFEYYITIAANQFFSDPEITWKTCDLTYVEYWSHYLPLQIQDVFKEAGLNAQAILEILLKISHQKQGFTKLMLSSHLAESFPYALDRLSELTDIVMEALTFLSFIFSEPAMRKNPRQIPQEDNYFLTLLGQKIVARSLKDAVSKNKDLTKNRKNFPKTLSAFLDDLSEASHKNDETGGHNFLAPSWAKYFRRDFALIPQQPENIAKRLISGISEFL